MRRVLLATALLLATVPASVLHHGGALAMTIHKGSEGCEGHAGFSGLPGSVTMPRTTGRPVTGCRTAAAAARQLSPRFDDWLRHRYSSPRIRGAAQPARLPADR